jgi:hypothetical protein
MSDEQPIEEPGTFEDLPRHLQEMVLLVLLSGQRFQDAVRADNPLAMLVTAEHVERDTEALMRAILDAERWSDTSPPGFTPADATNMLLRMQALSRSLVPHAIEFCLKHAFAESDDPQSRVVRERTRATLVRANLLTEHELETFPPASATAIVWDRYRAWDEAN